MRNGERETGNTQSGTGSSAGRLSRGLLGLAVLCAAFCVGTASAFAAAHRSLDSQIAGFATAGSVAVDANDHVWVSDSGHQVPNQGTAGKNGIYEYDAYPSQTLLDTPDTYIPFGADTFLLIQLAVDDETGEVFVSQSNGRSVDIFDNSGVYSREWNHINGEKLNFAGIHIAIDNSNTVSRGRIYLSLTSPENDVEAVDAAQRPIDFPATASYIIDNKLIGTPGGPFGSVKNVAVDSAGNIYVTDIASLVVDEFESTGVYLRAFPAPEAAPGTPGSGGVAVDPTNGNVLITENLGISEHDSSGNYIDTVGVTVQTEGTPAVNSSGYLYAPALGHVDIFTPAAIVPAVTYGPVSDPTTTSGTLNASVEPNAGGDITECQFEYGTTDAYGETAPCEAIPSLPYSVNTEVSTEPSALTTEATYHYRVVVSNANGTKYGADQAYTPHYVVGLSTGGAASVTEGGATLNGSLVGDGTDTHYYFEWGPTSAYGNVSPALPGTDLPSPSGPSATPLSVDLTGLSPFSTYHYRVVATGGAGTSQGDDRTFTTPPGLPTLAAESISQVHSDRALLHAQINPNGADTVAHFEYVDDADYQSSGWVNATATSPEVGLGRSKHVQSATTSVDGLTPGTVYHYRAIGVNDAGTSTFNADRTFTTFPFGFNDACPNGHVRQQTGTALLLDCRAYELVSAANTGGYDVESDLVAGQAPFAGYPQAENPSQVLYGVHNGALEMGDPTNRGVDPYVATRGESGWSTQYVGIPASNPFAGAPFASTLDEADPGLDTFAFGGPSICSPCFEDHSTGIPIHRPNGELVQGMAGSIPQPAAEPAGFIGNRFSADGSHLVFGSTSKFEPDGNEGEISIYDRDLRAKLPSTHVVSKTTTGSNLPCLINCSSDGIGELDISEEGSRIVVGQLVSESDGAKRWHLYMNIGDSAETVDITPGVSSAGALYDGMSSDGTKVYFTTTHAYAGDSDTSADIYLADVSESGVTLTRISIGAEGAGDTDLCDPSANTKHVHWNTAGPEEDCGVVAVGGGGGVASADGTIYFLSPEKLDGLANGVQEAPNLYLARPGSPPHFVATLESSANAPIPPASHPFLRSFGSFSQPAGVAIDYATGSSYVLDNANTAFEPGAYVQKFDSSGSPVTSFGNSGKIDGSTSETGPFVEIGDKSLLGTPIGVPASIAVDNDSTSPSYGDLYVPDVGNSVVDKFDSSGNYISAISTSGSFPVGVAVDQSNGHVYVTTLFGEALVFDANGNPVAPKSFPIPFYTPADIAVDPNGNVYITDGESTGIYDSAGNFVSTLDSKPSYGVDVDPSSGHVYVDEGGQVREFDSLGNQVGDPIGSGFLQGSIGLAVDSGKLAISNPGAGKVASYGPAVTPPDPSTDNPLVVDSVTSPGIRSSADFQVSPSGDDAVFTSTLPLTSYDNGAHREIFRYHAPTEKLECASCNPTSEQATGEASLPANGPGLSDDGRVFFNAGEGLVDRDNNDKPDAYEWVPPGFEFGHGVSPCGSTGGCIDLISTGTSPFASSLLGVSTNGTDAYFFTRDRLVEQDENGSNVKIYDARQLGGFPFVPPEVPCKASDECHGPSSQAPPPPNVKSNAGTAAGNGFGVRCRTGLVRRHGRCVRKPHKRRHHHKRGHHHG